jgi:hypothetical protein
MVNLNWPMNLNWTAVLAILAGSVVWSAWTAPPQTARQRAEAAQRQAEATQAKIAQAEAAQAAVADETADPVEVLSRLWTSDSHSDVTHQFIGDSKIFKKRAVVRSDDGTVSVEISEAPFRYLELDPFPRVLPPDSAVGVRCLFLRECIVTHGVTYDPIYHDPTREVSGYTVKSYYALGYLKAADSEAVKQALRTLIRLNPAPPFDPLAPR